MFASTHYLCCVVDVCSEMSLLTVDPASPPVLPGIGEDKPRNEKTQNGGLSSNSPLSKITEDAITQSSKSPSSPPPPAQMPSQTLHQQQTQHKLRSMLSRAVSELRMESDLDKLRQTSRETVLRLLQKRLFRKDARPVYDIRFHKNATEFVFRDIKTDVSLSSMKLAFVRIKQELPDFHVRSVAVCFGKDASSLSFVCHHIKQAHETYPDIFAGHKYKKIGHAVSSTTDNGKANAALRLKRAASSVAPVTAAEQETQPPSAKRMKSQNGTAIVHPQPAESSASGSKHDVPDSSIPAGSALETVRAHLENLLGERTPLNANAVVKKAGSRYEIVVDGYTDLTHDFMFPLCSDIASRLQSEFRGVKVDILYKFPSHQFVVLVDP